MNQRVMIGIGAWIVMVSAAACSKTSDAGTRPTSSTVTTPPAVSPSAASSMVQPAPAAVPSTHAATHAATTREPWPSVDTAVDEDALGAAMEACDSKQHTARWHGRSGEGDAIAAVALTAKGTQAVLTISSTSKAPAQRETLATAFDGDGFHLVPMTCVAVLPDQRLVFAAGWAKVTGKEEAHYQIVVLGWHAQAQRFDELGRFAYVDAYDPADDRGP